MSPSSLQANIDSQAHDQLDRVFGGSAASPESSERGGTAALRVVVIGGGCTGAAFAVHLTRLAAQPVSIDIIEPRPALGAGVAYSSADPAHRINVPADRMSLMPDDKLHFLRWLGASGELLNDPDAALPDGRLFPTRATFGRYVADTVQTARAAAGQVIRHVRSRAVAIVPRAHGFRVELPNGMALSADLLVLAASNPPPRPPDGLAIALGDHPALIADPWAHEALGRIAPNDRVLVVGTGLTMADIVASLDRCGHRGQITAFSRRGLLPRGHTDRPGDGVGDFASAPATTAVSLLRRVRATIEVATRADKPWQHVVDALRAQGPTIWAALPDPERLRLLRHLRPYWDTHRYRIAPQVEAVLARRRAAGTLTVLAASCRAIEARDATLRAWLRARHGRDELATDVDAVVLATGPAHGRIVQTNEALASLAAHGLVRADPLGLGVAVDAQSRAVGERGRPRSDLFVAGPLARGRFGELMGLPEVVAHARDVALHVAEFATIHHADTRLRNSP